MMRKLILVMLFSAVALTATAKVPRLRVEWGLVGGINIPNFSTNMDEFGIKNKLGWQVGITTALNFGSFAVEPQILFVRQGLKVRPDGGVGEVNLRSNSIDVPILFSLRMLKPMRFYLGPVFTVMNDCKNKNGGDLLDFGRVRPTVSYAVGLGFVVNQHMLVDLRYNGQFRSKHDVVLPDGNTQLDKLRCHTFAITFGYLF